MPDAHTPASSFEGDYAPGQLLIGRYRIVALVGEGGMGQVYLADDLVLGQPVAVKFLPERVAEHEHGLDRFRAEVRHARDVTHPNVARVHDIGEVDGRHFLTMEFVDGEDLSSLVHRIGRLPREKAGEIAQQLCAGLAEAHRKGVLHRDLKPANVMLDGEGRVRLTDFGLAVAVDSDAPMAGTPQYMAPEQLAGAPASVQSEVYALGLLLYELYTGKRALRGRTLDELRSEHEQGSVEPPSSALADIDPAVDAVLTRCLARDPRERPASVADVARALPGGDPLAAALAAGETPSPGTVAAASARGALQPRSARLILAAALGLLVFLVTGRVSWNEERGVTYGKPPAVLDERARELAFALTGIEAFAHEVHWYTGDPSTVAALDELRSREGVELPEVQVLVRHSRFSPESLEARGKDISPEDPPRAPGSAHVVVDASGRLLRWSYRADSSAEPKESGDSSEPGATRTAAVPASQWDLLLERAGFQRAELRSVEPSRPPPVFATERRAWVAGDAAPGPPFRIEAAGDAGIPVHFEVELAGRTLGLGTMLMAVPGGVAYFMLTITVLSAVLAWKNVRARRAYVGGALLVAAFELFAHVLYILVGALPDDAIGFGGQLFTGVSYAVHTAVRVGVIYLALEPYVRRRWPRTLIAWSRLLEGRWRDPAVGREVLFGVSAAMLVQVLGVLAAIGVELAGVDPWGSGSAVLFGFDGPLRAMSQVVHLLGDAVMYAGVVLFLLVVLRSFLPAGLAYVACFFPVVFPVLNGAPLVALLSSVFMCLSTIVLLTRVGYLSVVSLMFGYLCTIFFPLTLRPGDWYFGSSLTVLATLAALGAWGYLAAVGRRGAAS